MGGVCKEWNVFLKDQTIWKTLAERILTPFPKGFQTDWRNWLKSPGTVTNLDSCGLDFEHGKMYIHASFGIEGRNLMFKRLLGPFVTKEVYNDGSEEINFRSSTESDITSVIRLKDGFKHQGDALSWSTLARLEQDPSVRKWELIYNHDEAALIPYETYLETSFEAHQLSFQTQTTLDSHKDKLPEQLVQNIQSCINSLKKANEGTDSNAIKQASDDLKLLIQKMEEALQ